MSGAPQFPDPLGVREVLRPGARASKAGPDTLRRVAALEEGAANRRYGPESLLTTRGDLIRRGASAPERVALGSVGTLLTSDGTDAVWTNRGPVQGGYATKTTDTDPGANIANLGWTASIVSITVTGDNATPMMIEFNSYSPFYSSGSGGTFGAMDCEIYDGTTGGTRITAVQLPNVGATDRSMGGVAVRVRVAAFSGSKTFNVYLRNTTGGNARPINRAGSTYPSILSATWFPT